MSTTASITASSFPTPTICVNGDLYVENGNLLVKELDIIKELNKLKEILHVTLAKVTQIEEKVEELYYSPGMPGEIKAKSDFNKRKRIQ